MAVCITYATFQILRDITKERHIAYMKPFEVLAQNSLFWERKLLISNCLALCTKILISVRNKTNQKANEFLWAFLISLAIELTLGI